MNKQGAKERSGFGYWIVALSILSTAMILPSMAIMKSIAMWGIKPVAVYFGVVSLVTILVFRSDKQQAEHKVWRFRERTLHFLELIGGWAGSFLAQRIFRHKTSKRTYQRSFWCIALIHNLVSFDYLQDWHFISFLYESAGKILPD